jgi:beta-galactosidase
MEDLEYILKHGAGVNIYMFHGGTSFGFMSGSSWTDKQFLPDVTSYDYDAPLDEAGHPTTKFFAYREILARYAAAPLPLVPAVPPVVTLPDFALEQSSSLWKNLPTPVESEDPQPMEHLGQAYGYILYRTRIPGPSNGNLELDELHDYALIFLDQKLVGTLDRRLGQNSVALTTQAASSQLDILVENSGRINTQSIMRDELKGITRQVRLEGKPLRGWQIFCLPLDNVNTIRYRSDAGAEAGPAFFRGFFQLSSTGDVFLDVHTLGKGALWINGHALGRFWNLGPQQTLYLPGSWLREGKNEVVVFDLFGSRGAIGPHLAGLPKAVLDAVTGDLMQSKQ